MHQPKRMAVLVGGSDLFSGMRGVSKGTQILQKAIAPLFDHLLIINYNYFLDFGSALKKARKSIDLVNPDELLLYGYSKGGDVVLQLSRQYHPVRKIKLLITVDVANGPWSHRINRSLPANVNRNINVYQSTPNFPLRSYGMAALSNHHTSIQNINLTGKVINDRLVNHSNI